MIKWNSIATAPQWGTDSRLRPITILCAFEHPQGGWVYFTAYANGEDTRNPEYAPPTHWAYINDPETSESTYEST